MMKTFTDHAHDKMMDLFNNHANEVGSELKKKDPVTYKNYTSTDCITYSLNVISYAFDQMGNAAAAKQVWKLGKHGTDLAKYLVSTHNWKGVYINPDPRHPQDANPEHSYSSHLAMSLCQYYKIPLEYNVQNYTVTPKTHPAFQQLNKSAPVSRLNTVDIKSLEKVRFGFGLSKGGMHTWLFSDGKVYEVHWDQVGSSLYEATALRIFPWLSGAIVIPHDQVSHLAASAKLKCGP